MAKAQQLETLSSSCKATTKKKKKNKPKQLGINFSESEIDAAEQLIQLSGDSETNNNHNHEEISDVSVTNSNNNIKPFFDDEDEDNRTISGFGPIRRKNKIKRFKSLSEIYSLTKPLSNDIVKYHHR